MESIHKKIKRLRLAKGLTQTQLAEKSGVKYQSVQEWEKEGGTAPTRKRMPRVATALGVPPEELTSNAKPSDRLPDLKPREEIMLLLFQGLFSHQQREAIEELRALFHANQIMRKELGQGTLKGVSNEQVRAAFKDVPAPTQKHPPKAKKTHRPAQFDDSSQEDE